MALGIKIKNVKTQNEYTIESLYEAIKDKTFTAGVPSLTKHGLATIITFPALDRLNQVWVMMAGSNKITIQKNEEAGVKNAAKNAAIGAITDSFGNMGAMFGKKSKECEKQVEATAAELEALNL